MKTHIPKVSGIKRDWYLLDAKGQIFGRLAAKAAVLLRGKHKRDYTPNFDLGDFVVIINAKKIIYSGKKKEQKIYFRHSNYPGGLKSENLNSLLKKDPTSPLRKAISGMLPANRLKDNQMKRLKIFAAEDYNLTQKLIKL